MKYEPIKENVEKRIETLEENKLFRIHYNIPVILKSTLDILIEQDIGYDDSIILNDVADEELNDRLVGYIEIEFDEFDEDVLFGRASQLDMLSNGVDLIERE